MIFMTGFFEFIHEADIFPSLATCRGSNSGSSFVVTPKQPSKNGAGRFRQLRRRDLALFTLFFPLLLFLIVEVILRLVGYGADLSLFRAETRGQDTYYVMNPQVKGRYFSRVQFNPSTSMDF